jgi:hypothetical protein
MSASVETLKNRVLSSSIADAGDYAAPATSPATVRDLIIVFFKHLSPWAVTLFAVFSLSVRFYLGSFSWIDLAVVAGVVVFWPIQEWLIHVFILHFKPITLFGKTIDPLVAKKHRAHHRDPFRVDLVFIPIHTIPLVWAAEIGLWSLFAQTTGHAWTGIATMAILTVHYEWVHYMVHTRYRPRSFIYGRMWRNHRLHHFMNEHYWYGVTMLAADRLLSTGPDRKTVEPSPTCRTLGRMEDLGDRTKR